MLTTNDYSLTTNFKGENRARNKGREFSENLPKKTGS